MVAIYCSDPVSTISLENVTTHWIISMPNFVKIPWQIEKYSMQKLDSDHLVFMAAICYIGPISAIPTNVQHLGKKWMGANFQIHISKTERLVRVHSDRRTDKRTCLNRLNSWCWSFIYILFRVFPSFPFGCNKLRG